MHSVLFPFYMQLHQKQKELFILPFSGWWNKMLPMHLVQQKRGTGRILASPVNLKRQSTPKSLFIKHNTIIILHCNEDAQIKGEENQWPHHLKCEIFSSNCLCVTFIIVLYLAWTAALRDGETCGPLTHLHTVSTIGCKIGKADHKETMKRVSEKEFNKGGR